MKPGQTFVTEFKISNQVSAVAFLDEFKRRFPEGFTEVVGVFSGQTIVDGAVPLKQKDEVKPFWEEFCKRYNVDLAYGSSRFQTGME